MAAAESKRDRSKSTTTLRTLRSCVLAVVVLVLFSRPAVADGPAITTISTKLDPVDNPFWSEPYLFFASSETGKIYAYQPGGNEKSILDATIENNPMVTFIVPLKGQPGHFGACVGSTVETFIWNLTTANTVHKPIKILSSVSFGVNDPGFMLTGKTDGRGRLWVGTDLGSVYRVVADGAVALQLSGISISGFAWNTNGTKFYRSDHETSTIVEHDFDIELGDLDPNGTMVFDFTANNVIGIPGGIAVDTEDNMWVACTLTSAIVKIDIKKGVVLTTINVPGEAMVSSLTFGSKKLDSLFVTTITYNSSLQSAALYQVDGTGSTGSRPELFDLTPQLG